MKKILKHILLFVFAISLVSFTGKENPKNILLKLNKVYLDKSYQMDFELVAKSSSTGEVLQSYKGKVAKQGKEQFVQSGSSITILNKKHYLFIDHSQKIIVLNDVERSKGVAKKANIMSWLDSSINKLDMTLKSKLNGNFLIEVKVEGQSYDKLLIYVDSKTFYLKKISFLFSNKNYDFDNMTVTYSNIKIGKKIKRETFSLKAYLNMDSYASNRSVS